jgi:hypothetical protein
VRNFLTLQNLGRLLIGEINDQGRNLRGLGLENVLDVRGIEGCRGQAELAQPCIAQTPTDDGWQFFVVPIWGHLHYVLQGRSNNPSDPVVMCDPWLYRFWTEPRKTK